MLTMGMRDDAGFLLLLSIPGWVEIDAHRVDHVIDLEPEWRYFPDGKLARINGHTCGRRENQGGSKRNKGTWKK